MKKKYPINLTGLTFGRLTVLGQDKTDKTKNSKWFCVCDCGIKTTVCRPGLIQNHTRSCGCLKMERLVARVKTHGKSKTRSYHIWISMHARCNNPNTQSYPNYGGRGISVCYRWSLFKNFYEDMGPPLDRLSIERINNSEGYSKKNCKWATREEQMNNMRSNKIIEYGGEQLTYSQAARKYGIGYFQLRGRLRNGWSVKDAIEKPKWPTGAHSAKHITFNGVTKTRIQWSVSLGGSHSLVCQRIRAGWSIEKAVLTKPRKRRYYP